MLLRTQGDFGFLHDLLKLEVLLEFLDLVKYGYHALLL